MNFRQHITKLCVGAALLGGLAILVMNPTGPMAGASQAMPAVACTPTSVGGTPVPCTVGPLFPITPTPGALSSSVGTPIVNNGAPITLSANDQSIPFNFTTTIADARGTGVGWNISGSATAVTFTAGSAQDPTLDFTTPVSISCTGHSTCANPGGIVTAVPGADMVTAPVSLANALAGNGLGSYAISTYGVVLFPGGGGGPTGGGSISVTVSAAPI